MKKRNMGKTTEKTIKRVLCITLSALLTASLASCSNQGGSSGNVSGIVAEASDSNSSKEAVFRMETPIQLSLDPSYVFVKDNKVVYLTVDFYEEPDFSDAVTEEPVSDATEEGLSGEDGAQTGEETATEENGETAGGENDEDTAGAGENTEGTSEAGEEGGSEDIVNTDTPVGESSFCFAWVNGDLSGSTSEPVVYRETKPDNISKTVEACNLNSRGNLSFIIGEFNYDEGKSSYTFKEFSTDGKMVSDKPLNIPADSNVNRVCIADNGMIVFSTADSLLLFDDSLNKTGQVPVNNTWMVYQIFSSSDGKLYTVYFDEKYNSMLSEVKVSEQKLSEGLMFPGNLGYSILSGPGHDFYSKDPLGIYAMDIEGTEIKDTPIFNFLDSDIMGSDFRSAVVVDEETILLIGSEEGSDSGIYKKVPPEQVKDKQIITMGSVYSPSYDVRKRVLEYNKTSDSYRIRMVNYEEYYTDDDPTAPETQFKNDILANAGPDIIMTDYMVNPGIYISKGVFADMYPLLEKNGIRKEDYLTNILDAGSKDGHLYILMPAFSIDYIAVKKSILGSRKGLTMQEMIDLEQQYNCKGKGLTRITRDDALQMALVYTANSYYDLGTGECRFDSENFIKTLEWAKNYPETLPDGEDYYEAMKNDEIAFRKNEALMLSSTLYEFRSLNELQQVTIGEEVEFIGFPGSEKGDSGVIRADLGFAISALGDNQNEAFDFIKYYLSEEYQMPDETSSSTYQIPILKKALDEKLRIESEKPFYYNEETKKKEYSDETGFSYVKGKDITINSLTPADQQKIKEFINRTTNFTNYDKKVFEIVKEESAPFFAGQKSAEETARIIQSRVSIYVTENQ